MKTMLVCLRPLVQFLVLLVAAVLLTACLGSIVGAAVDVTLEVAKVPFKVAGAAIDVATPDDEDDDD